MPHLRAMVGYLPHKHDENGLPWLMENYDNEEWFSLYKLALVELEDSKLSESIGAARQAILVRIDSIHALSGHHPEELHAIEDALRVLNLLQQERC